MGGGINMDNRDLFGMNQFKTHQNLEQVLLVKIMYIVTLKKMVQEA